MIAAPKPARPRRTPRMKLPDIRPFLDALHAANPDAESELVFEDPFTLLVAVVLSAQTTDAAVNKATPALFAVAPNPAAMAALGADGIAPYIRSIGLWQGKARNVAALSRILVEQHGGGRAAATAPRWRRCPAWAARPRTSCSTLPSAEATMAVDTHIFSAWATAPGWRRARTVRVVEDGLVRRIPPDMLRPAHHWLILHGRYVCKARTPECWRCTAAPWCGFPDKTPPPAGQTAAQAEAHRRR